MPRLLPLICSLVVALFSSVDAGAQSVVVKPWKHSHTFLGGGAGVTLYPNHLIQGTAPALRDLAYDWLYSDLDLRFIRISFNDNSEPVNDNADPFLPDMSVFPLVNVGEGIIGNVAKTRNPRTEFIPWAQDIPLWLRNASGNPDYSNPNLFLEVAEWWYMNLVDFKVNKGLDVRYLDVANEPDWNGFWGPSGVRDLLTQAVPHLRTLVNMYAATYGVEMPRIIAPSCLGTGGAVNYLQNYRNNHPNAWQEIDVCSTHQYGAGFNTSNFATINGIRGARGFFMTEMHPYHQSVLNSPGQPPANLSDDHLEAMLLWGRLFSIAVNGGCEAWCHFQANTPSNNGLIGTPWGGAPYRRKIYYAAKHLTATQTRDSDVCERSLSGFPNGVEVIAFNRWGENRCVVTVTNALNASHGFSLALQSNSGSPLPITSIRTVDSDASQNYVESSSYTFVNPLPSMALLAPALSIRTFDITFANPAGPNGEPLGEIVRLESQANGSYVSVDTADPDLALLASSSTAAVNEKFQVVDTATTGVHLMSLATGLKWRAEFNANGNPVRANGRHDQAGGWTRFDWLDRGGNTIGLSVNGLLVRSDSSAMNTPLRADGVADDATTRFDWSVDQPGTFTDIGTGCPGTAGALTLSATGVPAIGQPFAVSVSGYPVNAPLHGLVGITEITFDLTSLGAPGCILRVDPLYTVSLPSTGPASLWSQPIPNDPALIGLEFFLQAAAFDAAANVYGVTLSNGGRGVIGN